MNKSIGTIAKVLAGIGALNWGTSKLISLDLLSIVPTGAATTAVVALIGASGAAVLYWVYKKKI